MASALQPSDRWEELKEVMHHLYVVQDLSLAKVMKEMASQHQFTATKSQYETQLKKKWGFRKYLKAEGEDLKLVGRQFALAQKGAGGRFKGSFQFQHAIVNRPLTARTLRRRGALTALAELHPEVYERAEDTKITRSQQDVSLSNEVLKPSPPPTTAPTTNPISINTDTESDKFGGNPPFQVVTASFHKAPDLVPDYPQGHTDFSSPHWYKLPGVGLDAPRSKSVLRFTVEQNLDVFLVKHYLDSGAKDLREPTDMTLVELSVKNRNHAVTKLLLSRHFSPDSTTGTQRTALQYAVINGDFPTVLLLLHYAADPNFWVMEDLRTPLEIAVELQHLEIVKLLLKHGANVDGRSSMISGTDNDTCLTPLQIAAKAGSLDIVNTLLQYNANFNKRRSPIWYKGLELSIDAFLSPLQLAISCNHVDIIETLLAHGADPNDRASRRTLFDSKVSLLEARQTPLQLAVSKNRFEAVNILLDHKADVNALAHPQGGATALQYAAMVGSVSIAKALLARGADVNAPAAEHQGRTPLEAAAENGHLEMIRFILGSGVIVYRSDCARAVMRARNKGHAQVVEFLKTEFKLYYT